MPTGELIRIVTRLKLRLGFRHSTTAETVFTVLLVLVGVGASAGGVALLLDWANMPDRATRAMLALTAMSIGWLFGSIVFGGGEGTLEPERFAPFPITDRQLTAALLAAAFLGAPAAATLFIAVATALYAPSVVGAVVMLLCGVLVAVTAVLSGRVGMAAMSRALRGRRTREFAGGVAALFGVSIAVMVTLVREFSSILTPERLEAARSAVRWLPWGWGAEAAALASEGRLLPALILLVAALGFAVLLLFFWWRLNARLFTTRDVAHGASTGSNLVPVWLRPFGRSPVVAVWARSIRQLRRDPREFLEVAGFLPMMVIFAIPSVEAIRAGSQEIVLSSASLGVAIGITSLNMFGADGRSFGVDVLALGTIHPLLIGKALARISLGVPLIGLMSVGLAAATGGWTFVAPSVLIGLTGLLSMAAVGMFVSTRFPFPLPEKAMVGGQGATGCATGLVRTAALISAMVISAPAVAATALATVWVSAGVGVLVGVGSLVYSGGLFLASAWWTDRWASRELPRIFQQLASRP